MKKFNEKHSDFNKKETAKKVIKKLVPLILVIGMGSFIYTYYINKPPVFIGTAEVVVYPCSSEISAKITDMNIDLGQNVEKEQVIAKLDGTDQDFNLKQLELNLEKAKIALSDSKPQSGGSVSSEYALASANYNSAKAAAGQAERDYDDIYTLYDGGAVSEKELEKVKLAKDSADFAVAAAKAKLDLISSSAGTDTHVLNVAQLELQLEQAKSKMTKYSIVAPRKGVVVSKSYSAGDFVNPGQTILEIGAVDELYLTFYLPEKMKTQISSGDIIKFKYIDKTYTGKVTYIDVKKQFTPVDQQTAANKNKKSFKVKLLIDNNCPISPGEEAEVLL